MVRTRIESYYLEPEESVEDYVVAGHARGLQAAIKDVSRVTMIDSA